MYQLVVGAGVALAHCPEIHKACDRPIRTCQANTDCPGDAQCVDALCDTNVSTATRCFVTVVHAGTCTLDTQVNAAFDVQDFPTVADQRIPDVGNLPIVEVSGNAVCGAGPSLPCVIGPAGSTGNGLPGAGTAGLVSFAAEHTLSAAQLQDLATASATQLTDRATVTLQDLCTPGPECNPTPSDLQVTATSAVASGCSATNAPQGTSCQSNNLCEVRQCDGNGACVVTSNVPCNTDLCQVCVPESGQCVVDPNDPRCAAGVDLGVRKTADCVCGDDQDHLIATLGTDGEVVVCGRDDDSDSESRDGDHSLTAASRDGDDGSNDEGSDDDDQGSDDHGSSDDDGSHDDGESHDGDSHDGSSDDDSHDDNPLGCTIGFTVTVTNHGSETATNAVIHDTLPSGVLFIDAIPSQGTFDPVTGTWLVGTLSGGASATLTIHEDRGDEIGQCIENCAEVTSLDQADGNPANDFDCVTVFTGGDDDGKSDDGHSADSDDHSGDSDDSSDSASDDQGAICVPGGDDHVCDEVVPPRWHKAHERWSKLLTKAAQAKSARQEAVSLRKAKGVLRRMQRITVKLERTGTVSDDCIGKLRSRLEALSTETRRVAR